jgi:hypothetical protein
MSDAAVIGALSVILGGDASAFNKMLSGAQSSVSSFAKNVTSIAAGMGLEKIIAGALSSVSSAISKGLDDADALSKMSAATGVSVEQLSKLKYAGDVTGVSLDTLGKSLDKLSQDMMQVANGSATPAADAFAKMGVSVKNTDGTLKSSATVLSEIADKFAGYKDGAAKAALAQAIFGDSSASMIAFLNKGGAGLAELGDEAQRLGLVLDGPTQFAVQSLNENLKKMDAIKQGLVATIVSKMAPAFEQISEAMLSSKENSVLMSTAADGLTIVLKGVISVALQAIVIFDRLAHEAQAAWAVMVAPDWTSLKEAWKNFTAEARTTDDVLAALKNTVATIWAGNPEAGWDRQAFSIKMMSAEVQKLGLTWTQTNAPIIAAGEATKNALQLFLDTTAKRSAATAAEAATVGQSTDAQARLKVELEAQAIATAKGIALTGEFRQKITDAGNAAAAAAQKLSGANLTQASLTPWQQRNTLLTQYKALLDAGAISSATFSAASLKIQFPAFTAAAQSAMDFGAQVDQLATNSLNGLASTLAAVITGTKTAAEAFTAFALQIITQLIEMVIKAVLFKIIMTAIGFSGGGPVGTIVTGGPDGPGTFMATGGFIAGPGTATSDSIPAMLSNGEFVVNAKSANKFGSLLNAINLDQVPGFAGGGAVSQRVSSASSTSVPQSGTGRQAAAPVTVQMKGAFFDRATLADMIDGLNGMFRNGYKLKVA